MTRKGQVDGAAQTKATATRIQSGWRIELGLPTGRVLGPGFIGESLGSAFGTSQLPSKIQVKLVAFYRGTLVL